METGIISADSQGVILDNPQVRLAVIALVEATVDLPAATEVGDAMPSGNITVRGAKVGDFVLVTAKAAIESTSLALYGHVTAANTVVIGAINGSTSATFNPLEVKFVILVLRFTAV